MNSTAAHDHSLSVDGPWIHIILFDLSNRVDFGTAEVIWNPSDALNGYIVITANAEIEFYNIQIQFEGRCPATEQIVGIESLKENPPLRHYPNQDDICIRSNQSSVDIWS